MLKELTINITFQRKTSSKNNLINAISELSINQENELIQITFKADTISSAITFTESIINNTESKINKINYKNYNESIGVTLVFNS